MWRFRSSLLGHSNLRRFFSAGPSQAYAMLVKDEKVHYDALQERAISYLQCLHGELSSPSGDSKGVYLYGGVGRGKTMLMDLFHASLAPDVSVRAHSHAFFLALHAKIYANRSGGEAAIIQATAAAMGSARVLCLDEIEISDIADAVLMRRVYSSLRSMGRCLVATSNRPPSGLYESGLNREGLFLPFEVDLCRSAHIVSLDEIVSPSNERGGGASTPGRDYRVVEMTAAAAAADAHPLFLYPQAPAAANTEAKLDALCALLAPLPLVRRELKITAFDRSISIHRCSLHLARFTYASLCSEAYSAADYLAMAREFSVFVISDMAPRGPDALRRLITLIDILYESRALIILSADVPLETLLSPTADAAVLLESAQGEVKDKHGGVALGLPTSAPAPLAMDGGVKGEGGSSGRSTLYVGAGIEWSATGRSGASLAHLGRGASGFLATATARAESRLHQMTSKVWAEQWGERQNEETSIGALFKALEKGSL